MATAGSSAEEYSRFRRQRLMHRLGRWRKLWKVFYRSPYGKAGFWILLVFAAITLLSPILTLHNPYTFIAPIGDSFVPSQELAARLPFSVVSNGTPLAATANTIVSVGSFVVYVTASNGSVYGIGLGDTPSTPTGKALPVLFPGFPPNARVFPATAFTLLSLPAFITPPNRFVYSEYLLVGATWNGTSRLVLAEVNWTGIAGPGDGVPYATDIATVTLNGTLLTAPAANSFGGTSPPQWAPFYQSAAVSQGLKPGYIYAVTESAGAVNLTAITTQPLSPLWSVRLPYTTVPSVPVFLGCYYRTVGGTSVLISQNNSVFSYSPGTGKLLWQSNFSAPVSASVGPIIPYDDQLQAFNRTDVALLATGGDSPVVDALYLSNGTSFLVTAMPAPVVGLATSTGEAGFPANLAVSTASLTYFLGGANPTATAADALSGLTGFGPLGFNPVYDASGNLMIVTSTTGNSYAVRASLGANPIQWRAHLSPSASAVGAPVVFLNAATGKPAIAFSTSTNRLEAYAMVGTDENPLPPTFNAPSGNIYIFGTNTYGNDLWSQWIASFVWDWEIGLAVTAGIMAVAVLTAMFIGYISNWVAAAVETVTLVLFLLPGLALLIVVASILGASFLNIIAVLTLVGWPYTAFTLIGVVRQVKSRTFVEASRASGARTLQILRRHMLPNMTPLLAYFTALSVGGAATALSTLQFLGVAPLTIPTWGGMLEPMFGNYYLVLRAPFWVWPPTIALTMFVFAFVFVSRGLDEVVNPRIRAR